MFIPASDSLYQYAIPTPSDTKFNLKREADSLLHVGFSTRPQTTVVRLYAPDDVWIRHHGVVYAIDKVFLCSSVLLLLFFVGVVIDLFNCH